MSLVIIDSEMRMSSKNYCPIECVGLCFRFIHKETENQYEDVDKNRQITIS